MMLNTDLALPFAIEGTEPCNTETNDAGNNCARVEPHFTTIQTYANDNNLFLTDFAAAFQALAEKTSDSLSDLTNGCTDASECNDNLDCTEDVCSAGECSHTLVDDCCEIGDSCDDGDGCTNDLCLPDNTCSNAAIARCCTSVEDCNEDVDTCQTQSCVDLVCVIEDEPNCCATGDDCDDNVQCTIDICVNNQCVNTLEGPGCCLETSDCVDGDLCTMDSCVANTCVNEAEEGCCVNATDCEDQDPCTVDSCSAANTCENERESECCADVSDCDDGDACTVDTCENNQCTHVDAGTCCEATTGGHCWYLGESGDSCESTCDSVGGTEQVEGSDAATYALDAANCVNIISDLGVQVGRTPRARNSNLGCNVLLDPSRGPRARSSTGYTSEAAAQDTQRVCACNGANLRTARLAERITEAESSDVIYISTTTEEEADTTGLIAVTVVSVLVALGALGYAFTLRNKVEPAKGDAPPLEMGLSQSGKRTKTVDTEMGAI